MKKTVFLIFSVFAVFFSSCAKLPTDSFDSIPPSSSASEATEESAVISEASESEFFTDSDAWESTVVPDFSEDESEKEEAPSESDSLERSEITESTYELQESESEPEPSEIETEISSEVSSQVESEETADTKFTEEPTEYEETVFSDTVASEFESESETSESAMESSEQETDDSVEFTSGQETSESDTAVEPEETTPEELFGAVVEKNRVSSVLDTYSNLLVRSVSYTGEALTEETVWYYEKAEGAFLLDATTLDTEGTVISSYTVYRDAFYGQGENLLSFAVLPDTDPDFLAESFGFHFFPTGTLSIGFSEDENAYYFELTEISTVLGSRERLKYTYTVDRNSFLVDSVEIALIYAGNSIALKEVTVTRGVEDYVAERMAYQTHLNAEDAIRLYVQSESGASMQIYTVSASSKVGVHNDSFGTSFALYKNEKRTKDVEDLSFTNGSDVLLYVGEWNGDISLSFGLTEETLEEFRALVEEFQSLALEGKEAAKIIEAYYAVDELYEYINSQAIVAYVNYYSDLTDPETREIYIFAENSANRALGWFRSSFANIATSDSPFREILFAGWSDEDIAALTVDNSAIIELMERNNDLLSQYMALAKGSASWGDSVNALYEAFVANNQEIALLAGFENYYEYAASERYFRDYSALEREVFRSCVKQYVVPLYEDGIVRFQQLYGALNLSQREWIKALFEDDYDTYSTIKRYVDSYIASFTPTLSKKMSAMFQKDVMIFGVSGISYSGAFSAYLPLYEEPISYFGPGYTDLLTVLHENGHYASFFNLKGGEIPGMDLCEVHSQGNEWLFTAYLEDLLEPAVYEVFVLRRLLDGLGTIIYATAVDECEELIYSAEVPYTADAYDALLDSVISTYGEYVVKEFQLKSYFKQVAMTSPVYYISYATSELASIALYMTADADYQSALDMYTVLVDEVANDDRFLSSLQEVGLPSPFAEETFIAVCDVFGRYFETEAEDALSVA